MSDNETKGLYCKECGALNEKSAQYCRICGRKLSIEKENMNRKTKTKRAISKPAIFVVCLFLIVVVFAAIYYEPKVPDKSEEAAQSTQGLETKDLKIYQYKNIEVSAKDIEEKPIEDYLWDSVMFSTRVYVYPPKEVEKVKNNAIDNYKEAAEELYNESYEEYIKEIGYETVEEFEKDLMGKVKEEVKKKMIVEAIAKKENLMLDNEELDTQLEIIKDEFGYDDVADLLSEIEYEDLVGLAQENVVKLWLVDHCVQTE